MDKGVVEVEVDAMVVELGYSSRILDLEASAEVNAMRGLGEVGVVADVVGDVECTPTKECSDVVALAPPTVGMVFSSWEEIETYYRAYAKQQGFGVVRAAWCVTDSQIEDDLGVKTSKKFITAHRKEEMNCHVKRKLKLGHSAGLKDIRNELYREKKLKLKDGGAKAMPDRATYEEFNDMVWLDTTYLTNQCELPFVNFIGVNHHGQTILLGCALISHDTTETFEWVFRTWVHCMRKIAPGGILTDQAIAMRNTLRSTMPETRHRWCMWHTTEKFSQKLGKCKGYNEFKDEVLNAIYDSLSVPEFESSWMAVINKHGLEDNMWLDGMKTTQRVESIHYFDDYVNKHTTLVEFAKMYYRSMEKRFKMERQYDAHSETFIRQITSHVWCHNKEMKKEYLTQYKRNYQVLFDMKSKLAECVCSLFNHYGIICRHMIKLYDILGEEVPDRYILRRTQSILSWSSLKLLDIKVDEKRLMIETEILNQTPSSVCLKDKQVETPASTTTKRKADSGIPTPESDRPPLSAGNEGNVKDPPRKVKPAHRTTDYRYYSAMEKAINVKSKTKTTVSKGTSHHIDVNQGAIVRTVPGTFNDGRHNPAPTMNNCQMGLVDTHNFIDAQQQLKMAISMSVFQWWTQMLEVDGVFISKVVSDFLGGDPIDRHEKLLEKHNNRIYDQSRRLGSELVDKIKAKWLSEIEGLTDEVVTTKVMDEGVTDEVFATKVTDEEVTDEGVTDEIVATKVIGGVTNEGVTGEVVTTKVTGEGVTDEYVATKVTASAFQFESEATIKENLE
ncbi:Protein FAR1-RELATED SEQUENCE 3 [Bienertia sinuspersici]